MVAESTEIFCPIDQLGWATACATVTDDNVAIVYGSVFYQWQYAVVNSIEYGELHNSDYFTLIPDYISFSKIKEMKNNGAIYLVKRPMQNKAYDNVVNPE